MTTFSWDKCGPVTREREVGNGLSNFLMWKALRNASHQISRFVEKHISSPTKTNDMSCRVFRRFASSQCFFLSHRFDFLYFMAYGLVNQKV